MKFTLYSWNYPVDSHMEKTYEDLARNYARYFFSVIEILLPLMYNGMVLMIVSWRYRMPFEANGCVSTQMNVDWIKWMYFCVNEFEVGVIYSISSGNEQQKVYFAWHHHRDEWLYFETLVSFFPCLTTNFTLFQRRKWQSNNYGLFFFLQSLALFVACLCHDLDHRGRTNSWMKKEGTALAAVYTTSPLEHHHFNQTVTILQVTFKISLLLSKR